MSRGNPKGLGFRDLGFMDLGFRVHTEGIRGEIMLKGGAFNRACAKVRMPTAASTQWDARAELTTMQHRFL